MLIEKTNPTAIFTLSCRTDLEAFQGIHHLSKALQSSRSTLMRLAISNLLSKQKKVGAKTIKELIYDESN